MVLSCKFVLGELANLMGVLGSYPVKKKTVLCLFEVFQWRSCKTMSLPKDLNYVLMVSVKSKVISPRYLHSNFPDRCVFSDILDFVQGKIDTPLQVQKSKLAPQLQCFLNRLYFYVCINVFIYMRSCCIYIYQSIYLSDCLSICLSINILFYLSICWSIYISIYLSIYLSICWSI